MGKRGTAPTPTAKLKQRGSWRADIRTNEPQFEDGTPECPDWLRSEAKTAWDEVVPQLAAVPGLLKAIDGNALARYCQTWAKWRACEEWLEKHGDMFPVHGKGRVDSENKYIPGPVIDFKQYPQVNTAIKLDAALFAMEKQFGMTASARAGLTVSDAPPVDTTGDPKNLIRLALSRAN